MDIHNAGFLFLSLSTNNIGRRTELYTVLDFSMTRTLCRFDNADATSVALHSPTATRKYWKTHRTLNADVLLMVYWIGKKSIKPVLPATPCVQVELSTQQAHNVNQH